MEVRKIIMAAIGCLLVLAIGLLYMRVSRSHSPEIDPSELAKAESEFKASSAAAEPAPIVASTTRRPPPRPPPAQETTSPEPSPPAQIDRPATRSVAQALRRSAGKAPGAHPTELGADQNEEAAFASRIKKASKLYDRRRFPEAREAALELLQEQPGNVKLLRIVVSASCIMFEPDVAREYFQKLPEQHKKTMRLRCARYEVENLD